MFLPVAINTSCTHTHRVSCTQKVLAQVHTHVNTARSQAATLLHDLSDINFSIFFFPLFQSIHPDSGTAYNKIAQLRNFVVPRSSRSSLRCDPLSRSSSHTLHPTAHRHTQHAHLMGGAIPTERLASLRDTHRDISQRVVDSQQL